MKEFTHYTLESLRHVVKEFERILRRAEEMNGSFYGFTIAEVMALKKEAKAELARKLRARDTAEHAHQTY